mgnify:CR=1 FL=1
MATTRRDRAKKRARRAPVQSRARASRDAILRASAQLLREPAGRLEGVRDSTHSRRHGLLARAGAADFTTNHVATRAGVSIGTLYEYFRDKDAITGSIKDFLGKGK